MLNHLKVCGGETASVEDRRKCVCGKEFAKSYLQRHRKKCAVVLASTEETSPPTPKPRVYKGKKGVCNLCGKEMAATNIARHKHEACPFGEPGS